GAAAERGHGPWGDFDLSDPQILDLVGSATALMLDAVHFPVRLPGVIQVLGGPDRTSRRLKALAGLFSGGADLVGVFQEGVDVTELLEVAKAAAGIVENGLALRDWARRSWAPAILDGSGSMVTGTVQDRDGLAAAAGGSAAFADVAAAGRAHLGPAREAQRRVGLLPLHLLEQLHRRADRSRPRRLLLRRALRRLRRLLRR